jgi:glutamine amidotransferase
MCRFAAYFGNEAIVLDQLLSKPENSLIKQSYEAKEGSHGVNADGFGVAWYNFDISRFPGVFKSTQPAWNDNNLIHISEKVRSACFLAHIRASTVGDVNQSNCHPFYFEDYSMVHNGTIRCFDKYKKKMIDEIEEDLFLKIRGNTDSECFFFLIMHFLRQYKSLEVAVKKAIEWVVNIQESGDGFSRINIIITNGYELIATRFVSKGETALSLNYSVKSDNNGTISSLILSSESLNDNESLWNDLPINHYIYINKNDMKIVIDAF